MPSTVGVNNLSVVHKGSGGLTIAFPDVCKTPTPAGPVPLPYPNIAKTAAAVQKRKRESGLNAMKTALPGTSPSAGGVSSPVVKQKAEMVNYSFDVKVEGENVLRMLDPMVHNAAQTPQDAARLQEIATLKGMLNQLNMKLQALPVRDPNAWQAVLQEYSLAASALYLTQRGDE